MCKVLKSTLSRQTIKIVLKTIYWAYTVQGTVLPALSALSHLLFITLLKRALLFSHFEYENFDVRGGLLTCISLYTKATIQSN